MMTLWASQAVAGKAATETTAESSAHSALTGLQHAPLLVKTPAWRRHPRDVVWARFCAALAVEEMHENCGLSSSIHSRINEVTNGLLAC